MKKFLAAAVAAVCVATVSLCGCVTIQGVDGVDGKNGGDVSIHEIYEATNEARKAEGLEELSFLDFVSQYLSLGAADAVGAGSLQSSINRSLLSGVSIAAGFTEYKTSQSTNPFYPYYPNFPGFGGGSSSNQTKTAWYFGSGVIIDLDKDSGDAYVVTNCHVIYDDDAVDTKISKCVYLFLYGQDANYDVDNCAVSATVVGASRSYDIALLKVEGSEILKNSEAKAAEFVADDDLDVGETVYAVGNPEGYGLSATQGIISKDSEYIQINLGTETNEIIKEYRVMRTDAAINSGNSGGGLFNKDGKLVGVVNAKASASDIDNMGFALPSGNVRRLLKLMHEQETPMAGSASGLSIPAIAAEISSKECASVYHADANRVEIIENVYVSEGNGSLLTNDAIRHIKITDGEGNVVEDKAVTRLYHLTDTLLSARTGYKLTLTVSRGGQTEEVEVPVTFANVD